MPVGFKTASQPLSDVSQAIDSSVNHYNLHFSLLWGGHPFVLIHHLALEVLLGVVVWRLSAFLFSSLFHPFLVSCVGVVGFS